MPAEISNTFGPGSEAQPAFGTDELNWRRSSLCGSHGSCVEIASLPDGGTALRDGKSPDRVLFFSREEWDAFMAGVKAGEFG
ncbi:MAG TPA: DUF397 domain-containing protein [Streptosporangiaceae bacterium]|nr:DUF397 domain-containing protein [Streptosporangiaceae bacterium]